MKKVIAAIIIVLFLWIFGEYIARGVLYSIIETETWQSLPGAPLGFLKNKRGFMGDDTKPETQERKSPPSSPVTQSSLQQSNFTVPYVNMQGFSVTVTAIKDFALGIAFNTANNCKAHIEIVSKISGPESYRPITISFYTDTLSWHSGDVMIITNTKNKSETVSIAVDNAFLNDLKSTNNLLVNVANNLDLRYSMKGSSAAITSAQQLCAQHRR